MKKEVRISMKETERISVLDSLVAKRIKQKHAATQLGVSVRQVRRLLNRYRREGIVGLTHKNRGRMGNRSLPQEKKDKITVLIKQCYPDFGPTLATEKLLERNGIVVSRETVRRLMIKQELWHPHIKKQGVIHTYRERRSCVGELIQLDGSPHHWFEERAPACTLVAFIDDATSRIMDGAFVDYEGTFTLFDATEHYLETHGKPLSLYVDKHSTFKINRQATIEEELKDLMPQSQFGRAMSDLRIEMIFAHSPQAKGRVERLFETLQDRLVKELRLEGISDKVEGTRYFREVYIPKHNSKFAVLPKDPTNVHRKLLPTDDLSRICTIQSLRVVSKVLVVQYKNIRYQLLASDGYQYLLKKALILIEEDRHGGVSFRYKNKTVPYKVIQPEVKQPRLIQVASAKSFQEKQVYIPAADHPWRKRFLPMV